MDHACGTHVVGCFNLDHPKQMCTVLSLSSHVKMGSPFRGVISFFSSSFSSSSSLHLLPSSPPSLKILHGSKLGPQLSSRIQEKKLGGIHWVEGMEARRGSLGGYGSSNPPLKFSSPRVEDWVFFDFPRTQGRFYM